ncbi:Transcription factor, fungi [Penicillium expansum]|nr:Transcription factor, fungi [Penicillium expansum]
MESLASVSPQEFTGGSAMLTPPSAADSLRVFSGLPSRPVTHISPQASVNTDIPSLHPNNTIGFGQPTGSTQSGAGEAGPNSGPGAWFLEDDFDVSVLDFSITSTISEWAQIPNVFPAASLSVGEHDVFTPVQSSIPDIEAPNMARDAVKRKWFTHMSPSDENRPNREFASTGTNWPGQTNANESYRAGLSQKLRRPMEDEALPSSEQLNLFAKLYFHRFHPLLPVIHAPSFRPTAENSLLFLSICSIGSLFVGSSRAVAQGSRIFERLNKAILASWESFLSESRPDALSMVQAAILGQTYALLAGKPKYLVLADVLHGTVASWAREANRLGALCSQSQGMLNSEDIERSWHRWIDSEQRARVQAALNIHDAELAALYHHEPIRNHRFRQFPRLASDELFSAPTASQWAVLLRQSLQTQSENQPQAQLSRSPDPFPITGHDPRFTAYGILEGISARLIDAKQSQEFTHLVCQDTSNLLIHWWQTYHTTDQDPFCLPVLWHSIFISLYADMDLLEQAVGRDGRTPALEASAPAREWASSLNASRCLVHASLIARYLERMSISAEPAIHVPRALFSAALVYLCVAQYVPKHVVSVEAFASPELKLLGDGIAEVACFPGNAQSSERSVVTDLDQLYGMIDLLQRGGRWGISQAFANVLSTVLDEGKGGVFG